MAAILGRNFVLPDDVKRIAAGGADASADPAARKPAAQGDRRPPIVEEILGEMPVPTLTAEARAVMKWFLGATLLLARRPGLPPGPAGLRHVRAAGRDAREPVPGPHLDREPLGATRECNRLSANVGETVAVVITIQNDGALPVAWLLVEDLLPRQALIYEPPSLRVTGQRLQLAMFSRRGRKTMSLPVASATAAATTRSGRWCSRRATCSGCTAAIAWPPRRTSCWSIRKVCRWRASTSPRGGRSAKCG